MVINQIVVRPVTGKPNPPRFPFGVPPVVPYYPIDNLISFWGFVETFGIIILPLAIIK